MGGYKYHFQGTAGAARSASWTPPVITVSPTSGFAANRTQAARQVPLIIPQQDRPGAPFAFGLGHDDHVLMAKSVAPGVRVLPDTRSSYFRLAAKDFQSARRDAFVVATPDQKPPTMTENPVPAGPRSMRSRLTSSRRHS